MYDFLNFKYQGEEAAVDSPDYPAIIIPNPMGQLYLIQYGGVGCNHVAVRGEILQLPPTNYGNIFKDERPNLGSIFDSHFWYYHCLNNYFVGARKLDTQLLYDLIDKEIEDRCASRKSDVKATSIEDYYRKYWPKEYQDVKVDRVCALNREAMMVVDMVYYGEKIKAVLTWENCD